MAMRALTQLIILLLPFLHKISPCRGFSVLLQKSKFRKPTSSSSLSFSYIPFAGLTGELDQEAESLQQTTNDYVVILNAWKKAFDQNPSTDQETKVLEYGHKMELILTKLEQEQEKERDNSVFVATYDIVIQMYLTSDLLQGKPGDPIAALRVLSRMEQQQQQPPMLSKDSQRLTIYNRVLQGFAMESPVLCSLIAVPLLQAMANQSPLELPKDEQVNAFTPKTQPNTESFVIVLEPLVQQNHKVNAYFKPISNLLQLAHEKELIIHLLGKILSMLNGDRDHLDGILLEAELEQYIDMQWEERDSFQ